ncbi:MAG: carbon-nitrogen hydrolase family protein [Anaerolineae bacterium]|nr:carbon-nitrogen hydrolase family protein [Anaerolineae bacterium]
MDKRNQKLRIGMLKAMPQKWNLEANWAVFEAQFHRHARDDLDFFITPECFLDGYAVTEEDWTPERFFTVAQHVESSRYIQRVQEMARRSRTRIVFGFTELMGEAFYNCALLVGADGEIVGKYHKTHLQTHDLRFAPGQDLPVFVLDVACVGIVICADRRWPETIRTLRLKGAQICLMPTYGMWHLDNEWWMRTRAYENQMYVCFTHPNVALITNPKGGIEAKLQSNVPDVLVHEVDLAQVTDDNHLADRRPELYGALVEPVS